MLLVITALVQSVGRIEMYDYSFVVRAQEPSRRLQPATEDYINFELEPARNLLPRQRKLLVTG